MGDVAPLGFFKSPHSPFMRDPLAQEDVYQSPADINKEEDRGQQKLRDARNQEGPRAEASYALESVATPDEQIP
ncbi:hypothetical protein NDU88_006486 [Pleurodeles waltl]|uniref:Uncharacterized protein n=1 Tax=Pleurodeles waltl TaxID=8319 RepID=A0AAV7N0J5_PLEWA|nr:hypothetical protein NDU88_006486 [Pleurodeles waltl]